MGAQEAFPDIEVSFNEGDRDGSTIPTPIFQIVKELREINKTLRLLVK